MQFFGDLPVRTAVALHHYHSPLLAGQTVDGLAQTPVDIAAFDILGQRVVLLLAELGDDAPLTGFTQAEIDSLTNDIDGLIDGETVDEELRAIEELFNVSLTFDKADQEELKAYVKDYGKEALIEVIIQKAKGEI